MNEVLDRLNKLEEKVKQELEILESEMNRIKFYKQLALTEDVIKTQKLNPLYILLWNDNSRITCIDKPTIIGDLPENIIIE